MTRRKGALAAVLALAAATPLAISGCTSVMTAWQDASNRDMTHRIAPALVSTAWIHPGGQPCVATYDGHWTVLVFFDTASRATPERLPALCAIRDEYLQDGVVVIGVTEADLERTTFFLEDHPVNFSVLAEAQADRVAFGIKNLFEPVVYLVDPYQRILAAGIEPARLMLEEKHGH